MRSGAAWSLGSLVAAALAVASCAGRDDSPRDPQSSRTLTPGATPAGARGATPDTASRATSDARPTVLIVGTSLTAGFGLDDPNDAYPAVLQRIADSAGVPVRFVNAGLSGETSAGALRRLDWLLSEPPALVIVETGANDGLRGLDPDSTAANMRAIVARVRALVPTARVAIAQMEAPPNLGADYTSRFRRVYPQVAGESGATLLPFILEGVAGVAELNQTDGIHPTPAGARRIAANVWTAIGPLVRGTRR